MSKKKIIGIVIVALVIIASLSGYAYYKQKKHQDILDSITLTFKDVDFIEYGSDVKSEDFIENVSGEVTYPELKSDVIGKQSLKFIVEKEGLSKDFSLDVEVKDTQKPIIQLKQEKVTLDYGASFDVNQYIESVKDPVDGDLKYVQKQGDSDGAYYTYTSDVDTKKAGDYDVKLIAVDQHQNQSVALLKVTVKEEVKTPTTTPSTPKTPSTSKPTYVADNNNKVIVINPGHQGQGNNAKEAIGPGSSTMKAKVSSGATGVSTKIPESKTTLQIGLKLRDELQARGYTVVMTRTSQNVNMSNQQRAQVGNDHNAAAVIHLHCDGSDNSSVRGAHTIAIAQNNPYCPQLYSASSKLAQRVIQSYCSTTGIKNRGVSYRNDLTGLNWSEVPAIYIEMGFVSNASEDQLLNDDAFQTKCAQGIADGIDAYLK